jgi:hypothetical protein
MTSSTSPNSGRLERLDSRPDSSEALGNRMEGNKVGRSRCSGHSRDWSSTVPVGTPTASVELRQT